MPTNDEILFKRFLDDGRINQEQYNKVLSGTSVATPARVISRPQSEESKETEVESKGFTERVKSGGSAFMENLQQTNKEGLETLDTIFSIGGGVPAWMTTAGTQALDIGALSAVQGVEKVGDLVGLDILKRVGLENLKGLTSEEIVELTKARSEDIGSKFYQPQTEVGQSRSMKLGKAIDYLLTPARATEESYKELGYHRSAFFMGLIVELTEFYAIGAVAKTGNAKWKARTKANEMKSLQETVKKLDSSDPIIDENIKDIGETLANELKELDLKDSNVVIDGLDKRMMGPIQDISIGRESSNRVIKKPKVIDRVSDVEGVKPVLDTVVDKSLDQKIKPRVIKKRGKELLVEEIKVEKVVEEQLAKKEAIIAEELVEKDISKQETAREQLAKREAIAERTKKPIDITDEELAAIEAESIKETEIIGTAEAEIQLRSINEEVGKALRENDEVGMKATREKIQDLGAKMSPNDPMNEIADRMLVEINKKIDKPIDSIEKVKSKILDINKNRGKIIDIEELSSKLSDKPVVNEEAVLDRFLKKLYNETGTSPEITELSESVYKGFRTLIAHAEKLDMPLEEFLHLAKVPKETIEQIINHAAQIGKGQADLDKVSIKPSTKEFRRGDWKADPTVAEGDQLLTNSRRFHDSVLDPTDNTAVAYMIERANKGWYVPRYRLGNRMPKRTKSSIEVNLEPKLREGFKDIGTFRGSPNRVVNRVLDINSNWVIDAFKASQQQILNETNYRKWWNYESGRIPKDTKAMKQEYQPILDRYKSEFDKLQRLRNRIDYNNRLLSSKGIAKVKKTKVQNTVAGIKNKLKLAEKDLKPMRNEIRVKQLELADKYPSARVALHAARKLPHYIKLSPEELKLSKMVREYLDLTGKDLLDSGIATIDNYIPHLDVIYSDIVETKFKGFKRRGRSKVLEDFLPQRERRGMWFPDIHSIMDAYIPLVERKLARQRWRDRWGEWQSTAPPKMKRYMDKWEELNWNPRELAPVDRAVNLAIAYEYVRLIGGSLSVMYKHLLKQPATWTELGFIDTAKGAVKIAKVPVQFAKEKLGDMGYSKKQVEGAELGLYRTFYTNRAALRAMQETPVAHKWVENAQMLSGSPTQMAEMLDNGVTIFAGLVKGRQKHLGVRELENAIWKNVLEVNFRGGIDQPLWYKGTLPRMLMMFQITPFKLAEFKYNLVKRAFRNEKDIFGTSGGARMVKWLAIVGAAEMVARANDTSVLEMMLHPPFLNFHDNKVGFSGVPLADLIDRPSDITKFNTIEKVKRAQEGNYPSKRYDSGFKELFGMHKVEED